MGCRGTDDPTAAVNRAARQRPSTSRTREGAADASTDGRRAGKEGGKTRLVSRGGCRQSEWRNRPPTNFYPATPTEAVTVPPVMAVVIAARTYRT